MFILHNSNKTENLLAHLATVIAKSPLSNPFAKEMFLLQSQGMERWLAQQLASHFQVWGNYEFLFPGKFFNLLAQKIDSNLNDEAFERSQMLWRFESLLRDLKGPVFKPLQQYLSGSNSALKRFQLAQQVTQIFDQYQMMRVDLLTAWQHNKLIYSTDSERWQQQLWLRIIQQTGSKHRGALWLETIAKLNQAAPGDYSAKFPERISVFGVNSMPPLFLDFLQGMAHHCEVHIYLLNPAQSYWADLESTRQGIKIQESTGHPLLATLGQQGREFQEMLLQQTEFNNEFESFEPGEFSSNLHCLQNDILDNRQNIQPLAYDGSLSIHACHSRMREVEVLRNQLLESLSDDNELELREIIVMAPDIQVYAPFISAVFDDIQHAIADRSLRLSNVMLDAFIKFLHLCQGRFGWQTVLDLLEQPAVYPGFGLSETDLEQVRYWVEDTRIRWGKSAEHRKALGLPELAENTWQAGLERLLMGYAIGSDEDFVDGVLPYTEIEGSMALVLGGLHDFLQLLFKASTELAQAKPLKDWSECLLSYSGQLFVSAQHGNSGESSEQVQLHELIADLAAKTVAFHTQEVELQVVIAWLDAAVSERKSSNGFLRGQLTFCSMLPMRSIPFKVIALLGMNEGEFPNIDRQSGFDLMTAEYRKGDRSRRTDDRYQFLEILLSARKKLIMTYIGHSISQNHERPPSVVVSELMEVMAQYYQLSDLVLHHPLQPFSERNFDAGSQLFSYSKVDCEIAKALVAGEKKRTIWWQDELTVDTELAAATLIDLQDLFAFYRHPQKFFMQKQMGIRFTGINIEAEERENFALNSLDTYWINQQWIAKELADQDYPVEILQAQGHWFSGSVGEIEYAKQREFISVFVATIKDKKMGEALADKDIDILIGEFRLVGKLTHLYEQGSLLYRFANLQGKDFLQAYLQHMIINQLQEQTTYLVSMDEDLAFNAQFARQYELEKFLEIYRRGQTRPDAFFVEAALAYIQHAYKLQNFSQTKKTPIVVAREKLQSSINKGYEPELARLYQDKDDLTELLDARFEEQCQELLLPLWLATHG